MSVVRTQVAIVGAGPSGLFLGHLLHAEGIDCILVELRTPERVASRIRGGVLEQGTVDLMARLGLDARLKKEALVEEGFSIHYNDERIRIDIANLTGKNVYVYGQSEITKDLMDAIPQRGLPVVYEAEDVAIHDVEGDAPYIIYRKSGVEHRIDARIVVGCDGKFGPSRSAIPDSVRQEFELVYPFGWLGILADVPPCSHELIYANHARGFALASMRSWTRSRYFIDVPLTEKAENWSDDRLWDELAIRLGAEAAANMQRGPSLEKAIAPLRSYIHTPMRHGSLMLCGDAAHLVPPTGAKGLNTATSDVHYAAEALLAFFKQNDNDGLAGYSEKALARVRKAVRFSWWLTKLTHHMPGDGPFERAMQVAELDYIASSKAAQTVIAENYVGLPV